MLATLSLLDLPQEILGMIISNITPRWLPSIGTHKPQALPNLRLTCKQLCVSATPEFGRVCLSRCRVVVSEPGLKGLIGLTDHPVLASHVRIISFGTHVLSDDLDPVNFVRRGNYNSRNCELQFTQLVLMLREFRTHREMQQEFLDSPDVTELMARALSNIKRRNLKVTLGIYDDAGHRTPAVKFVKGYGFARTFGPLLSDFPNWDEVGLSWFLDWRPDPALILQILQEASEICGYLIQNLEIDACQGFSFPLSTRANHASWSGKFHRIIRRMLSTRTGSHWKLNPDRNFSLKWWDDNACCTEFCLQTDRERFEYRTWKAGHFQSRAAFEGITSDYGSLKACLFREIFREVRFEHVAVGYSVLVWFLERHAPTLERLELSRVRLNITSATASKFLLFLALRMPKLEVLEWDEFETLDEKIDGDDMLQDIPQRSWRGREEMKSDLLVLSNEMTHDVTADLLDGLEGEADEDGMSEGFWEDGSVESWEEGSEEEGESSNLEEERSEEEDTSSNTEEEG